VKTCATVETMSEANSKRELVISKGWVQAAVLVFLFGFAVLGFLAYRTYVEEPPVPQRVVDPAGNVMCCSRARR
jgi:nitric oxide reductase subunit B